MGAGISPGGVRRDVRTGGVVGDEDPHRQHAQQRVQFLHALPQVIAEGGGPLPLLFGSLLVPRGPTLRLPHDPAEAGDGEAHHEVHGEADQVRAAGSGERQSGWHEEIPRQEEAEHRRRQSGPQAVAGSDDDGEEERDEGQVVAKEGVEEEAREQGPRHRQDGHRIPTERTAILVMHRPPSRRPVTRWRCRSGYSPMNWPPMCTHGGPWRDRRRSGPEKQTAIVPKANRKSNPRLV
jgi:hypothetical protein